MAEKRVINRDAANERRRRYRNGVRDQILDHYGRSCACCGSTDDLQIDHVNGGGTAHRIELFGRSAVSTEFYLWLIAQGFPEGYQAYCRPCNASKKDGLTCQIDHQETANVHRRPARAWRRGALRSELSQLLASRDPKLGSLSARELTRLSGWSRSSVWGELLLMEQAELATSGHRTPGTKSLWTLTAKGRQDDGQR